MNYSEIYILKKNEFPHLQHGYVMHRYAYSQESETYWLEVADGEVHLQSKNDAILKATIFNIPLYARDDNLWCLDYKYSASDLKKWFKEIA